MHSHSCRKKRFVPGKEEMPFCEVVCSCWHILQEETTCRCTLVLIAACAMQFGHAQHFEHELHEEHEHGEPKEEHH